MKALKVGIVGGAGQVGSALLQALRADTEVLAFGICRNHVSAARVASQGLQVRIAQTSDAALLADATRDLDVLVNCALPQYAPSKTSAVNYQLANSLAVASAGKHLIHLSSVAVYGDFIRGDASHFQRPRPDTGYGRQKLQMERLIQSLSHKHGAKATILRIGHVYGPLLRWSEAICDLARDEEFRLPFGGEIPSNAINIANLVAGIRKLIVGGPLQSTLNLVDSPQTTWRAIFDLHSCACGSPRVESLNSFDSAQLASEARRRGQSGLTSLLLSETWLWVKRLPASYISSVPSFKGVAQELVSRIGSETLDAKLWAAYCRRLSPKMEIHAGREIPPILFSETVPGPCLEYEGPRTPAADCLPALQRWYESIARPCAFAEGSVVAAYRNQ